MIDLLSELALDRRIHLKVLTDELTHDDIKAVVPEHMLWPQVLENGGVIAADKVVKKSIRELNPHIYHRPTGQLPFGLYSCKCVAGIADLTFRHLRTPLVKRLYKEISYLWTVQRADWIICISEYTRQDLIKRFHANPLTTSVAYLGANALPPAPRSATARALPHPAIGHPCTDPRGRIQFLNFQRYCADTPFSSVVRTEVIDRAAAPNRIPWLRAAG